MLRLSIIVPYYDVAPYIEQCIRSLYAQDIPCDQYEVLCVDDKSPDKCSEIIEGLQDEFPTLYLIHHDRNRRVGAARNTGLRAARGQYVWMVDSDDYICPNCLGRLLRTMDENLLDFIHFDNALFDGTQVKFDPRWKHFETNVITGSDLLFYPGTTWYENHVAPWRRIYRRDYLLANNLFFEEDMMYEDNDYVFRVHAPALRTMHCDYTPYIYRLNSSSITHTAEKSPTHVLYWIRLLSIMRNLWYDFNKRNSDVRYTDAISAYVRWSLDYLIQTILKFPTEQQQVFTDILKKEGVLPYFKICTISGLIRYTKLLYL